VLLLFDIDGTLVAGATEAHREAMHVALKQVHGIEGPERLRSSVQAAGRTDGEIARMILILAGVAAKQIDEGADAVREACCREYARLCPPDLSHTVIPGVKALLATLSGVTDVRLALLSGNYEPIARLKLDRAGIGKHFPAGQGAFGSDAEDRSELPAIARRRAAHEGRSYPRKHTVVIGDTPLDIACARADEVLSVAVATGPFSVEELSEADAVAPDAHGLLEAIKAVAGMTPRAY
jgi:phosphoglycolate phosphatase-like HAD superfamily hydrolase